MDKRQNEIATAEIELDKRQAEIEQIIGSRAKRMVEDKVQELNCRIEAAEEVRKEREQELLPPLVWRAIALILVIFGLLSHFTWWGFKTVMANHNSTSQVATKTEATFFGFGPNKQVPVYAGYIKALVNYEYNQQKIDMNNVKSFLNKWGDTFIFVPPKEEQPKQEKHKSNRTQAETEKQSKQKQLKKQDKTKPKAATAQDIKTIEALQQNKQPRQSEAPATGLQTTTPEQEAED